MRNRLVNAYRWRRTLASCRLDPRALPKPVQEPGPSDFILAGCPRTGTSLLCAMLHQPPHVVTVMEPWDGLRMEPAHLFSSLRREITETDRLSRGRLNLEALATGTVKWHRDGERAYRIDVADQFRLGVKWPTFWQYLDLLPTTRFLITLRDPVEVIASFQRVGGRLADGLEYDVVFNAALNREMAEATSDVAVRRALLYQHINSRILPYLDRENVFVVRYERWFSEPDRLRQELSDFLDAPLGLNGIVIRSENRKRPSEIVELVRHHVPVSRALGYDV